MNPAIPNSTIYAYRLTFDTGNAPCIFDLDGKPTGILTLACCKGGQIRKSGPVYTGLRHTIGKNHRDEIANGQHKVYLLGIFKNELLYFAQVTEIITMSEYFATNSQYRTRLDCIYDALPNGGFQRNKNNTAFHPLSDTTQHTKDWFGGYALISDCFAYFGRESLAIPYTLLADLPKGQENSHYDGNSAVGKRILDEVKKHWNFKDLVQNKPHSFLSTSSCGNRGCGRHENNPVPKGVRHC